MYRHLGPLSQWIYAILSVFLLFISPFFLKFFSFFLCVKRKCLIKSCWCKKMTEALSASFRVQEAEPEPVPSLSWIPAKSRLVCSSRWSQRLTLLAGRAAVLLKHIWRRGSLNSPRIVFLRLLTLRYLAGMLTRASRICWEFLAPSLALSFLSSPHSVLAVLTGACTVALWDLFFFLSTNPNPPTPSHHSPTSALFSTSLFSSLLCWYNYPCVDILLVPVAWYSFASYFYLSMLPLPDHVFGHDTKF